MESAVFRFDADGHRYTDAAGKRVLNITGLLTVSGHVDDRFFDEEGSERGKWVHDRTAEYDMKALTQADVFALDHPWKGYVLGYIAWERVVRPKWSSIEVPRMSAKLKLAGRCDRVGHVYGARSVCEIKTGGREKGHQMQTALQALLVAEELSLPAEHVQRWAVYVTVDGGFSLYQHKSRGEIREARRLIERYCA